MDTYDERVVAGEGDYLFSEVLLDLATQLQIPPPVFCGKMQYKEYGLEKWLIQTTIQGRLDEEGESTMEYTEAYVDWRYSVEIAMQGAIARIRHKYRAHIPRPSAYGMIGERSVGGHVVDRRGQEFHSLLRGYLTERERCTVNLEDMLKKQIINQDRFRDLMDLTTKKIMETESALIMLDDKKTQLENKLKIVEGPLQLGGKILQGDIWSHLLEKTLLLQYDNIQKMGDEKKQTEEANNELKSENEKLKMKLAELEARNKEEESEEEEDPEERIVYSPSDGLSYEEWEAKALRELKRETS
jgi:hypothetical protein